MIYSVAQRDQFSRQGREYFAAAARAERALPQTDPFPRSLARFSRRVAERNQNNWLQTTIANIPPKKTLQAASANFLHSGGCSSFGKNRVLTRRT